jgi:predicted dehydrogenase
MNTMRIGVLSTARIVELGIVIPAKSLGYELYSIAARDPPTAQAFAKEQGFTRYHASYEELISDPNIDMIYNPLPNGLHGPWNIRAMQAGKHVLTEKPFASNFKEAIHVWDIAKKSHVLLMEGYHYSFHPVMHRMLCLLKEGMIGDLERIDIVMCMPEAPESDPRWLLDLAGGSLMDLGCYAMHIFQRLAPWGGGPPRVVDAVAHERLGHRGIDEKMDVNIDYPNGLSGATHCDMAGDHMEFTLSFTGARGRISAKNFLHPHLDDRIEIDTTQIKSIEHLGKSYTYVHQLQSFLDCLANRTPPAISLEESVATIKLVDTCYRMAGMKPRPSCCL